MNEKARGCETQIIPGHSFDTKRAARTPPGKEKNTLIFCIEGTFKKYDFQGIFYTKFIPEYVSIDAVHSGGLMYIFSAVFCCIRSMFGHDLGTFGNKNDNRYE